MWNICETPIGPLTLEAEADSLRRLSFPGHAEPPDEARGDGTVLAAAEAQLHQYFSGRRRAFELPLRLGGTPFQQAVWRELLEIPFGTTISYSELAERVGRPDVVRAVGAAVGRTPIPIVIPCHRVVGKDGSLTGYGGGLERKRALLDLERRARAAVPVGPR